MLRYYLGSSTVKNAFVQQIAESEFVLRLLRLRYLALIAHDIFIERLALIVKMSAAAHQHLDNLQPTHKGALFRPEEASYTYYTL